MEKRKESVQRVDVDPLGHVDAIFHSPISPPNGASRAAFICRSAIWRAKQTNWFELTDQTKWTLPTVRYAYALGHNGRCSQNRTVLANLAYYTVSLSLSPVWCPKERKGNMLMSVSHTVKTGKLSLRVATYWCHRNRNDELDVPSPFLQYLLY